MDNLTWIWARWPESLQENFNKESTYFAHIFRSSLNMSAQWWMFEVLIKKRWRTFTKLTTSCIWFTTVSSCLVRNEILNFLQEICHLSVSHWSRHRLILGGNYLPTLKLFNLASLYLQCDTSKLSCRRNFRNEEPTLWSGFQELRNEWEVIHHPVLKDKCATRLVQRKI